jgi:hypothetical protein
MHPKWRLKGQGPPWKLAIESPKEIHPTRTSSSLSPARSLPFSVTWSIPLFKPAHLRIICSSSVITTTGGELDILETGELDICFSAYTDRV